MSNIKSNWDGLTGLFSIVFGLAYGGYAYSLPQPMFGNPLEAIFLPLTVSAIAIFIGLLLIITGGMTPSFAAIKALLNESPKRKSDRRKVAITALLCVFYAMLFEHAGYVISTFLFMFSMLTVTCGLGFWKKSALISVIFAVAIFITFNEMLSVNLPPFPFFN
ncbi:tripartite tricarboxylate transporter TctB family protein [Psychromonas sp. B3M02]|uniref:tripartite tricarboxylate transporter TctB family protein n=1 Tax=Psychromonas sp. B3M02 TaxID=2267226 RepID=UPI000DEB61E9|nr:tripartite tricarboxylate transporter TctB family protein [Psychromonas sp. B3M02]RBW47229.1 tripartite tricarboxylate transporter TctB family protein [Psychromonas sp. B3M02]